MNENYKDSLDVFKQSSEISEAIFDAAADGLVYIDNSGRVVTFNKKAEEITGYKLEEGIGKNFSDLDVIDKKDLPILLKIFSDALASSKTVKNFELVIKRKDGLRIPSEVSTGIVRREGKIIGLVIVFRDISERKRIDNEIQGYQERLRIMFEHAPDSIFMYDMNGILIDGNKASEELIGYKREDIIGKNFLDVGIISKDQIPKAIEKMAKHARGEDTGPDEFTINKKDGTQAILEIRSFPVSTKGKTIILAVGRDVTERKKAEHEKKESEEKYKILSETSPDGILATDKNGIITYVNPALEKMFDIPFSVSKGTNFSKYMTEESAKKSVSLFMDIMKSGGGGVGGIELDAVHKDGHIFPIEIYASSILRDGKFDGIECTVRDITERKKAQEALKESEEKLSSIFDAAGDAIIYFDISGKLIAANKSAEVLSGYKFEDMAGKNVIDLIDPVDRSRVLNSMSEMISSGNKLIKNREINIIKKGGKKVLIEISADVVKKDENVIGITAILRDITERKKLDDALRESEENLRSILEAADDPIIYTDTNGRIIFSNSASEDIFGYKKEEITGKNFLELGVVDTVVMPNLLKAMAAGNTVRNFELTVTKKDGTKVPIEVSSGLVKKHGRISGFITIVRDITERIRNEEAIRESEEKLKSIFDAAEDTVLYVDRSGKVLAANKAVESMFGYKREEIEGTNFTEHGLIEKSDMPKVLSLFSNALVTGSKLGTVSMTLVKKDGTKIPVEVSTGIVKKEGIFFGTTVVIRDVTERKKAEDAIRESEDKLRSIIEAADDPIIYSDVSAKIIFANRAVEDVFGFKREEIIGKSSVNLSMIDSTDMTKLAKALTNGQEIKNLEITITKKDGTRTPVEISSGYVKREGKISGFITVVRDITERKKAESYIRESQEKLSDIYENVNDEIMYIDINGKIIDVNKRTEEISGYTKDEIIGKNFTDLNVLNKKDIPKLISLFGDAVREGKQQNIVEMEIIHKNGNIIPVEVSTRILKKQEKIIGLLCIIRDVTERKKAEEAIRESEEKLSTIFEAAGDVIVYLDKYGKIVAANKTLEEVFGYKRDEVIGKNFADVGIADMKDIPHFIELMAKSVNEEKVTKNIEMELIRKDGSRIPTDIKSDLIKKYGKTVGVIAIIRDITERKRAEAEIKESQDKLNTIFETASDGIAYIDKTGTIIAVNKRIEELFGYEREEIIARNFANINSIDPKDMPRILNLMSEILKGSEKVKSFEMILTRKDGTKLPVEINTGIIKEGEKVSGLIAIIRDITERKKTEEDMREREEKFNTIFEAAGDGITYIDLYGKIIAINKRTEDLFGYKVEELIGRNIMEIKTYNPEDSPSLIKTVGEAVTTGKPIKPIQAIQTRKDGTKIATEISINVVKKNGRPTGIIMLVRDITERKKAEEALFESEEKLNTMIESVGDGIVYLDNFGKVLAINKVTEQMMGLKKDEIIGKNFADSGVVDKTEIPKLLKLLSEVMVSGELIKGRNFELVLTRKDKTKFPAEINTGLVKKGGKSIGLVAVMRDITERKKIEEEEKKRTEELERFTRLAVGRELRMVELKNRIKALESNQEAKPVEEDSQNVGL